MEIKLTGYDEYVKDFWNAIGGLMGTPDISPQTEESLKERGEECCENKQLTTDTFVISLESSDRVYGREPEFCFSLKYDEEEGLCITYEDCEM